MTGSYLFDGLAKITRENHARSSGLNHGHNHASMPGSRLRRSENHAARQRKSRAKVPGKSRFSPLLYRGLSVNTGTPPNKDQHPSAPGVHTRSPT